MKSMLLLLFLFVTSFFVKAQGETEDFKIISHLLYELEQKKWFPKDIYPRLPPPPASRETFIDSRNDLTPKEADSLYTKKKNDFNQHLKLISERKVDSSFIFIATENYLYGLKCRACGINPDTLLNNPEYSKYKQLVKQSVKRNRANLPIPFEKMKYYGRYQLKSLDEFPPEDEMYNGSLNFLSGGKISLSRFYQKDDLGLIYFSISSCEMDCSSGHLVLFERKNGKWEIFDILLQWIT